MVSSKGGYCPPNYSKRGINTQIPGYLLSDLPYAIPCRDTPWRAMVGRAMVDLLRPIMDRELAPLVMLLMVPWWLGSWWLGSWWLGSWWLGSWWLGSCWFGSWWLGSWWLGSCWWGSSVCHHFSSYCIFTVDSWRQTVDVIFEKRIPDNVKYLAIKRSLSYN